jgi:hypothetical protein
MPSAGLGPLDLKLLKPFGIDFGTIKRTAILVNNIRLIIGLVRNIAQAIFKDMDSGWNDSPRAKFFCHHGNALEVVEVPTVLQRCKGMLVWLIVLIKELVDFSKRLTKQLQALSFVFRQG